MESEIEEVTQFCSLLNCVFERVGERVFRVNLAARNGDRYQLEVECEGYPVEPAAFHWRNSQTGHLDAKADGPAPFDFFHGTGKICAPWNRLASLAGGPHQEWQHVGWQRNPRTGGTTSLVAMILRIHTELKKSAYQGRHS